MAASNFRCGAVRFALLCAAAAAVAALCAASAVTEVTTATLDELAAEKPVLLQLHASWCGHCKRFAPKYDEVAAALHPDVVVARADGAVHRLLAQRFQLTGFPSFYLLADGKAWKYKTARSVDGLVQFAESRGKIGGVEMTGTAGPTGPYWTAVGHALSVWTRVLLLLESYNISVGTAAAVLACVFVAVLVSFGLIIHVITKPSSPAQRPKQN